MGIAEREIKNKERKVFIKKAVLSSIALAGIISIAFLAPNAIQMLKPFIKTPRKKNITYSVNQAISRLQKQGLIYFETTSRGTFVRLTEKGTRYLHTHLDKPPKPRRWDGKWRILIFDIKEARRGVRDQLRHSLVNIGFKRLQNSVWVYPYDCEDLIILLKADFKMGKDVLYIIAEKIENDRPLKDYFHLS
ncbi:MAG: CRISPR-associated endonuclease Cas2 [Patescibacteria group bacterium]